jgi:pyruvate formate lyase activating enzyme
LRHVYEGNVPGAGGENTYCPSCSSLLVERYGFTIIANRLIRGACPDCSTSIAGIYA